MAKAVPGKVPPAGSLDAKLVTWGAGEIMYRIHNEAYAVDSFNASPLGNARFSPIHDSAGEVIPTLYAATTPQSALMETVFHDVPYKPGFKRVSVSRLESKLISTLVFMPNFELIDLSKVGLRRLGVHPHDIVDTTKTHYPETRNGRSSCIPNILKRKDCCGLAGRMIARRRSFSLEQESEQPSFVPPTSLFL